MLKQNFRYSLKGLTYEEMHCILWHVYPRERSCIYCWCNLPLPVPSQPMAGYTTSLPHVHLSTDNLAFHSKHCRFLFTTNQVFLCVLCLASLPASHAVQWAGHARQRVADILVSLFLVLHTPGRSLKSKRARELINHLL